MAVGQDKPSSSDGKVWGLFKLPFRNSPTPSSNYAHYQQNYSHGNNTSHLPVEGSAARDNAGTSVSSVARSLLPTRRRLKLDPSNKLYFPCMIELPLISLFGLFHGLLFDIYLSLVELKIPLCFVLFNLAWSDSLSNLRFVIVLIDKTYDYASVEVDVFL